MRDKKQATPKAAFVFYPHQRANVCEADKEARSARLRVLCRGVHLHILQLTMNEAEYQL